MRRTIELPSGRLAGLDYRPERYPTGTSARGATALFVPGYTGSKEDFLPLLRPLAELGVRAVAYDQRGQYESGWATTPDGYRIGTLAEDLLAVADEIGTDPLHLVGHSFGGLVARAAVLAKPERFASLTLLSSGPSAIGGARLSLINASEPVLDAHGLAGLWEFIATASQANPKYTQSPPAVLAFLKRRFLANDPAGLRAMGQELRVEPDRTAELAASGLPLLVLHGVDDDAWPPSVQADMADRAGARYRVVPDAAHSPAVENPRATLEELVSFWESIG